LSDIVFSRKQRHTPTGPSGRETPGWAGVSADRPAKKTLWGHEKFFPQLVAANTDMRTVADRLGHADAAFTINTYAHSSSESDRAAAAAIEAFQ